MGAAAAVEKWLADALRAPAGPPLSLSALMDGDEHLLLAELLELFCRERRLDLLVEARPLTLQALRAVARPQQSLLRPELLLEFGHCLLEALPGLRLCAVVVAWHLTLLAGSAQPAELARLAGALERHPALADGFLLGAARLLVRGELLALWPSEARAEFLALTVRVLAAEGERRWRAVADPARPRQSASPAPLAEVVCALCRPAWLVHLRGGEALAGLLRVEAVCARVREVLPRASPPQLALCADLLLVDAHLHCLASLRPALGPAPPARLLAALSRRCAAAGRPALCAALERAATLKPSA